MFFESFIEREPQSIRSSSPLVARAPRYGRVLSITRHRDRSPDLSGLPTRRSRRPRGARWRVGVGERVLHGEGEENATGGAADFLRL